MQVKNPNILNDEIFKNLLSSPNLHSSKAFITLDTNQAHTNIDWLGSRMFIDNGLFQDQRKLDPDSYVEKALKAFFYVTQLGRLAKSAIESVGGEIIQSSNFNKIFQSLTKTENFKEVLDIVALDIINNKSNKLLVEITTTEKGTLGSYSKYSNKVTITKDSIFEPNFKGTFIHELWHHVLTNVFNNESKPYFENDSKSHIAYKQAIYDSLTNIYREILNEEPGFFNSSYELGKELSNKISDNIIWKEFFNSYSLKTAIQLYNFLNTITSVFNNGYTSGDEEAEFIVRYEQLIASDTNQELLELLLPMKEYIDCFVKPVMHDYIDHHPQNHMLLSVGNDFEQKFGDDFIPVNGTCLAGAFEHFSYNQ